MPAVIGYARVSTDGQTLDAQVAALTTAGATKIFAEKMSGARSDRPALAKALKSLAACDVLMVTRLDRLARSTRDLLNTLHAVGERGAGFKSLNDQWCDTGTAHGRLLLSVLASLAEFEKHLIEERCSAGIRRARAAGIKFGRPRKLNAFQRTEALRRREAGEPQSLIAATYGVDRSTIARLIES
jgi:DNA invertase Pin-like site-specific DNA recombinase